jgi:maleylacetoacetate isomerase
MITLYDYYRSSAAFRVRIALNLKGIEYKAIPISLIDGENHKESYKEVNPQQLVPALETEDHHIITQSLAIIAYLEETHPSIAIMPATPLLRAQARSLAMIVACDIHPVDNLRVLKYVTNTLHHSEEEKMAWYFHWLKQGFDAFEALLKRNGTAGLCCINDTPSLADICLIPQVYNAKRFDFPLADYPEISRIAEYCLTLPAFEKALPERQEY